MNFHTKIVSLYSAILTIQKINYIMKIFEILGQYWVLMFRVFKRPVKRSIITRQIITEMDKLGVDSIGIVAIISIFIGAVVSLQMIINFESPFIPSFLIGYATKEVLILEFSSTVVALILAGKVGSNIASELGTMRITEQIDALEVMGVNSANYLILPKIIGGVAFFPFLTIVSMVLGILGGYFVVFTVGSMTPNEYITGLLYYFKTSSVVYGLVKMVIFAYIITSVSAFCGYTKKDNTVEVGRASTKAVVYSVITILLFNLIITKLFFNY